MLKRSDWTESRLPNLQGETVVITGANSGIGLEATKMLAAKGAHVVMACRSEEKAVNAMTDVKSQHPDASLEFMKLDLADLSSVRAFADELSDKYEFIDRLINNAGLMAIPYRTTEDGFEMQLGVNHFGHFALTNLVLPLLAANDYARVITVSSNAHKLGSMDWNNLHAEQKYSKWGAYGQSKLANLLFAYELQRKLESVPHAIDSIACHPGYAATELQTKGPRMAGASFMEKVNQFANKLIAQDAYHGALPTVRAAYDETLDGGVYVGPDGMMNMTGNPVVQKSTEASHDRADAAKLWRISEEATGTTFPLTEPSA
jgi:NAD(P)-dependent dehydrogenase (short-subunit alcohol dehydrogenase family)